MSDNLQKERLKWSNTLSTKVLDSKIEYLASLQTSIETLQNDFIPSAVFSDILSTQNASYSLIRKDLIILIPCFMLKCVFSDYDFLTLPRTAKYFCIA